MMYEARDSSSTGSPVFRFILERDSRDSFEAFRNDPQVPPTMRSGGATGPPEFTVVGKTAEFPG
jgi:hypothetical protein